MGRVTLLKVSLGLRTACDLAVLVALNSSYCTAVMTPLQHDLLQSRPELGGKFVKLRLPRAEFYSRRRLARVLPCREK